MHLPNQHLARYACLIQTSYVVTAHDLIRYYDALGGDPLIHAPSRHGRLGIRLDTQETAHPAQASNDL
jgi:hypothetical protein